MDLRYATALRNATSAWANHRTTHALTLNDLQNRSPSGLEETQVVIAPNAVQAASLQPQLARYGKIGTQINIYA